MIAGAVVIGLVVVAVAWLYQRARNRNRSQCKTSDECAYVCDGAKFDCIGVCKGGECTAESLSCVAPGSRWCPALKRCATKGESCPSAPPPPPSTKTTTVKTCAGRMPAPAPGPGPGHCPTPAPAPAIGCTAPRRKAPCDGNSSMGAYANNAGQPSARAHGVRRGGRSWMR